MNTGDHLTVFVDLLIVESIYRRQVEKILAWKVMAAETGKSSAES
jgi:hypothetical protein